jgi:hypothetical protein
MILAGEAKTGIERARVYVYAWIETAFKLLEQDTAVLIRQLRVRDLT